MAQVTTGGKGGRHAGSWGWGKAGIVFKQL